MHSKYPIGVFDSGVGGLSVLREIHQLLPQEDLIYVADSAHVPYGDKSKEFILERSTTIFEFFLSQKVKAIVVACNTATAAAVKELRGIYHLPMVAMEPAVKPAAEKTQTGIVGVLATSRTINSNNFQILFARFADQALIIPQACPGLVDQVEQGDLDSVETRALVAQYVQPLLEQNADVLVLGCTHYPFLKPVIQEIAGVHVQVIDSGAAIARRLHHLLGHHGLLSDGHQIGSVQFYSSAENGIADQVISGLWGSRVKTGKMTEAVSV
ncbi:glutamate racemase MurI [Methyloglobulus morosus KoM1]|uniref:Glutamate racemase n=1 Tax=Methyloglobulus morosus KoM1 TaxID=1116472 RepID=V5DPS5_9GAMM|nr:glutamate racemase [Methyloglobulus morosus]ESS69436.1 glutamate racemase MurI [Methyloglobulus morosus KoM1]